MFTDTREIIGSDEIVETAELLFQSQGFDNTTVRDIINRLNITDTTFFHYFKSTDEILELLWSGAFRYRSW